MGKGFNNYMCKKFFHPASRDNLKRVWMAQQKDDAYKKKQDELRLQYEKEQDLYDNKALLSKESKDKLSLNFMYEPPPGAKKEREKEENEPEFKFEWQRKYNAPREDYCKGNEEIQDQPFGIQVRNVRCIKCRKWGHINTDKECPLYNQATVSQLALEEKKSENKTDTNESSDAFSLLRQMKEDGLKLKKSALEAQEHIEVSKYLKRDLLDEEDEINNEQIEFLSQLSVKKKLKLLKKLEKLEETIDVKQKKNNERKKYSDEERKQKKKKKLRRCSDSDSSENDKRKKKKRKERYYSSSSDDSSNDDDKKKKYKKDKYKKNDEQQSRKKKNKEKYSSSCSSDSDNDKRKDRNRKRSNSRRDEYVTKKKRY